MHKSNACTSVLKLARSFLHFLSLLQSWWREIGNMICEEIHCLQSKKLILPCCCMQIIPYIFWICFNFNSNITIFDYIGIDLTKRNNDSLLHTYQLPKSLAKYSECMKNKDLLMKDCCKFSCFYLLWRRLHIF